MPRRSESKALRRIARLHLIAVVTLLCLRSGWELPGGAQEKPVDANSDRNEPAKNQPAPVGQFLTIPGTIDDAVYGKVSRAALALQARAAQEKRRGVLVLEISPGSSPFHHVRGLAKFLAGDLPSLTTVAWIPQTVTGNHVVVALACQEIIMKPEAELGDISLGTPLDPDDRSFVVNLANKRHNKKVGEALVLGMLDRQREVLWVQLELGKAPNVSRETRVVSRTAYDDLARTGVQIIDVKPIKEAGAPGLFSGERARSFDVLVMHTAQSRGELASLYRLPREAQREDPTAGDAPRAVIIKIDDVIEPILQQFVMRQIDRAVASGVNVIIFEIESPGGMLISSMELAHTIADLQEKKVRTVAWVPRQALSGAAIIALGCDEIYLRPEAMLGDAGPIEMRAGQPFERAPEKVLSVLKGDLKNLAARKGRPTGLAMAMADKDLVVFEVINRDTGQVSFMTEDEIHAANGNWEKGRQVPESGRENLLTVDGSRAHALHLAEAPVNSFDELKTRLGVPAEINVPVSSRTWVDTLIFILNTGVATTLLFIVGIMCIYFELHFPSGLFGILACVCFGLFFWSRFLGGTAGWLEVVLFLLGAGCLAIEMFIMPGFGVFGVSGIILCVCSLILASQTFVIPASTGDVRQLANSVLTLSGALVGVVVVAALISRYLPSMPLFDSMILTPPGVDELHGDGPRLRPELTGAQALNPVLERDQSLVGRQGTAMTVLRPAGKARIGDDFVDVVSEGPFIAAGRQVEILAVEGTRVVVREIV